MPQLNDIPCESCGRMLKAVNPEKGANYYYPCPCNRPVQTGMGVAYPGSKEHEAILASGKWNINDLLSEVPYPVLGLNPESGFCSHNRTQGDNYGVTCLDCGEPIAGYGYWGEGSKTCRHSWVRMDDESTEEICIYCQACRLAVKSDGQRQWRVGDLGRLKNQLILLLEAERSIWVSQGGNCGYWPAAEVEFYQATHLRYQYVHWKEVMVEYFAGKFTGYFTA